MGVSVADKVNSRFEKKYNKSLMVVCARLQNLLQFNVGRFEYEVKY
jgi:hypothetical protein